MPFGDKEISCTSDFPRTVIYISQFESKFKEVEKGQTRLLASKKAVIHEKKSESSDLANALFRERKAGQAK